MDAFVMSMYLVIALLLSACIFSATYFCRERAKMARIVGSSKPEKEC